MLLALVYFGPYTIKMFIFIFFLIFLSVRANLHVHILASIFLILVHLVLYS